MDASDNDRYGNSRHAAGVKTAALVIILGAVAVMADHAFFIAPRGSAPMMVGAAASAAPATPVGDGFKLPEAMHPNEGDAAPPPPSF